MCNSQAQRGGEDHRTARRRQRGAYKERESDEDRSDPSLRRTRLRQTSALTKAWPPHEEGSPQHQVCGNEAGPKCASPQQGCGGGPSLHLSVATALQRREPRTRGAQDKVKGVTRRPMAATAARRSVVCSIACEGVNDSLVRHNTPMRPIQIITASSQRSAAMDANQSRPSRHEQSQSKAKQANIMEESALVSSNAACP